MAVSARNAQEMCLQPVSRCHREGILEMSDFLPFGKVSFILAPTPFDGVFLKAARYDSGYVCTYICRKNVYVSQNRHFLKAVNLKVKLIEPIFSAHLLTLLMCMLNRRSQI